jgi:hypothetical protein
MPKGAVRNREPDPGTWPLPAGPWVMLLFWLAVVALTMTYWLFA